MYDFTQLNNGNLVFIGSKGGGVWTFVTDSTGKKFLWERNVWLQGVDSGGFPLTNLLPLSVCATPDSGFMVVGDNNTYGNNHNAFAMHFVPRPLSAVSRIVHSVATTRGYSMRIIGTKLVVTSAVATAPVTASLYSASGKRVAVKKGKSDISFDVSRLSKGLYFVRVKDHGHRPWL